MSSGSIRKYSGGAHGVCEKCADPQVGPQLAEHARHQRQVVVLHQRPPPPAPPPRPAPRRTPGCTPRTTPTAAGTPRRRPAPAASGTACGGRTTAPSSRCRCTRRRARRPAMSSIRTPGSPTPRRTASRSPSHSAEHTHSASASGADRRQPGDQSAAAALGVQRAVLAHRVRDRAAVGGDEYSCGVLGDGVLEGCVLRDHVANLALPGTAQTYGRSPSAETGRILTRSVVAAVAGRRERDGAGRRECQGDAAEQPEALAVVARRGAVSSWARSGRCSRRSGPAVPTGPGTRPGPTGGPSSCWPRTATNRACVRPAGRRLGRRGRPSARRRSRTCSLAGSAGPPGARARRRPRRGGSGQPWPLDGAIGPPLCSASASGRPRRRRHRRPAPVVVDAPAAASACGPGREASSTSAGAAGGARAWTPSSPSAGRPRSASSG